VAWAGIAEAQQQPPPPGATDQAKKPSKWRGWFEPHSGSGKWRGWFTLNPKKEGGT